MKRLPFLVLLVFTFYSPVSAMAGTEAESLQFYDAQSGTYTPAPGIASEMEIDVSGTIARTKVIQYFANNTDNWQEGVYTFPIPDKAAVDHLVMIVGERRVLGFVAQKQKARQIYEQAKREGKASGLVEQHRENLFRTSVANIPPHSLIAIEIAYQHGVDVNDQTFSLRVPMAVTPRYDQFAPEDFLTLVSDESQSDKVRDLVERLSLFNFKDGNNPVSLRVTLGSGFEAGEITSPSHPIRTSVDDDGFYHITMADKIVSGKKDFILNWQAADLSKPLAFIHQSALDGSYYSQLVLVPSHAGQGKPGKIRPRAVTMIIDVSGSMGGPSIRQAKAALIEALQDLGPQDYFNVISFESVTDGLFSSPVPASEDNIKQALKWVSGLEARGGTEMQPAVERALSESYNPELLRQIVFMTDGAIGYERALTSYIREHVGRARFYAVGIGAAPNSFLMRMIAQAGRGTFTYIGNVNETESKMAGLFKKMKTPVITDLVLELPAGISAETVPARLPDLMYGEPVTVTLKTDKPLDVVALSGRQGMKNWRHEIKTAKTMPGTGIDKIYAKRKIDDLMFRADEIGDGLEAQVTALGVTHQVISNYTSLVAVDEEVLREAAEPLVVKRYDPNLPEGWQLADFDPREAAQAHDQWVKEKQQADTQGQQQLDLPQTATGWHYALFWSLILIVTGLALCRKENFYA